ncbi:MFS transporter [Embleya sp. AB8]|uniref:MFS transporter n=1 Tax=Embleya sp. AB8 TaxID=3156304 RepID=UPI003C76F25E
MTNDQQAAACSVAEPAADRPPSAADGLFSGAYAAATASFAAVMFLTGLTALAVVPTLPTAARALDGVSLFPLVAGSFVAASLLGGVLGGHWADRSGAQRPLAVGMLLAVVTLLGSGTSTSIWQLIASRLLDGVAGGMVAVSINTAIGQAYPDRLRPRALALMSACWVVPSLVGPPLAGLVTEVWSWRVVYFGLAALTILPALAVATVLRGRARPVEPASASASAEPAAEQPPRPALLVAAAVSLGAALGQYGASGWDSRHAAFVLGGLALLVLFAPRLLPRGIWRAARGLPVTVLLSGFGSGTFFALEALVPLFLVTDRGVAPVAIGLAFTGGAVAWAASSWVQGRLLEHYPRHRLVITGALVMVAAVATAIAGTFPAVPAFVACSVIPLAAIGMGLIAPSLTVLSLSHSPTGRQGHASSAMQTSQNLGQITVLGLVSAILNACLTAGSTDAAGYATAFALLFAPCLLITLLATRARNT